MDKKSFAWITAAGLALALAGCGTADDSTLSQTAPAQTEAPQQPVSAAADTAQPEADAQAQPIAADDAEPESDRNAVTITPESEPKA